MTPLSSAHSSCPFSQLYVGQGLATVLSSLAIVMLMHKREWFGQVGRNTFTSPRFMLSLALKSFPNIATRSYPSIPHGSMYSQPTHQGPGPDGTWTIASLFSRRARTSATSELWSHTRQRQIFVVQISATLVVAAICALVPVLFTVPDLALLAGQCICVGGLVCLNFVDEVLEVEADRLRRKSIALNHASG